jgi:hypothetical protein
MFVKVKVAAACMLYLPIHSKYKSAAATLTNNSGLGQTTAGRGMHYTAVESKLLWRLF